MKLITLALLGFVSIASYAQSTTKYICNVGLLGPNDDQVSSRLVNNVEVIVNGKPTTIQHDETRSFIIRFRSGTSMLDGLSASVQFGSMQPGFFDTEISSSLELESVPEKVILSAAGRITDVGYKTLGLFCSIK